MPYIDLAIHLHNRDYCSWACPLRANMKSRARRRAAPAQCSARGFRSCFGSNARYNRQLQDGRNLTGAQPGQEYDLAAGKLERVVMCVRLIGVQPPKLSYPIHDLQALAKEVQSGFILHVFLEREFRARKLAADKARGVRLGGLNAKGIENQREVAERAERLRQVFGELADMSARKAAEELNRRGIPCWR